MVDFAAARKRHRRRMDAFRWELPERFNFARDVVGRHAEEPERPALLWRNAAGAERRLRYAEVARESHRVAHVLRNAGVAPGDPALVYYTSGTTGPPKAVLHAHAWTWAQRYTALHWMGLRPEDRVWTTSDTGWAKAAYSGSCSVRSASARRCSCTTAASRRAASSSCSRRSHPRSSARRPPSSGCWSRSPFEVESALLEHPDVVEAAVVAAPDAERGAIVKAFVVLRPGVAGDDALVRALQEHVKRVTAPYKYPRAVAFVAALPKTVSGKIRRVELRGDAGGAGRRDAADRDG